MVKPTIGAHGFKLMFANRPDLPPPGSLRVQVPNKQVVELELACYSSIQVFYSMFQ